MSDFAKDMQTMNDVAYTLLKHLEDNGVHPEEFDDEDALEHLEWEREQALRDCDNCGFVLIDRVECDFCGERVHD